MKYTQIKKLCIELDSEEANELLKELENLALSNTDRGWKRLIELSNILRTFVYPGVEY